MRLATMPFLAVRIFFTIIIIKASAHLPLR